MGEIMWVRFISGIIIIGALFILSGCSDDDNPSGSGNPAQSGTATIGSTGGVVEIPGVISLSIPAGALATDVDFSITANSSPTAATAPMRMISSAYTITPTGTNFSSPAVLQIFYNENLIGGGEESAIVMCGDNGSGWTDLTTTVDAAHDRISASIAHLSDYVAMVDTTTSPTEGVYAKLIVGRSITYFGVGDPIRSDMIEAAFDSVYAPCTPMQPIANANVSCDGHQLEWNGSMNVHTYPAIPDPMSPFIVLGNTYTFAVTASGDIPSLSKSITFPDDEPYVTSPIYMSSASLSGFEVSWSGGSGDGTVELILINMAGDSSLFVETANDGSYEITSGQLSGLSAGLYSLILNHYNREAIISSGYDSRSIIAARVMSTTSFNLQ